MQRILGYLEDGSLPYFLLDGQTVILDDYLEIRPQDQMRLRAQVEAGKLGIGPWYILPDEFLVSGEALIRNLQFGRERMRLFGAEGSGEGYLPDMFGHTAQMGQILRGFGINRAIVWRGVDPPEDVFWWTDLSGEGLVTLFLPTGYCNVHLWETTTDETRLARHEAFLVAHKNPGPRLLLSGCDHLAPNADLGPRVAALGARIGKLADALPAPCKDGLPAVRGELRQTGRAYLLPDVASARMPIKQANAELQDLWERYVEPLMALQVLSGQPIELGFWREGWELILKNQPHDSICGCSIDEVHREMQARFSQARHLGNDLVERSLDSFAPQAPGVLLYNPSGWERSGWFEVALEMPLPGWGQIGSLPDPLAPEAYSLDGLPTIALGSEECQVFVADIDVPPNCHSVRRCHFLAYVRDLPPFGIRHLKLGPGPCVAKDAPSEILATENAISNKFYRLEVDAGTLNLHLNESQENILDLIRFVDGGDAGDEYSYSPPEEDRLKTAHYKDYSVTDVSAARATLEVVWQLQIPAALMPDRKRRAMLAATTEIRTRLTLEAESRIISCETTLENYAQDHRLRAVIATGLTKPEQLAGQVAFGFVEREPGRGLGQLPVPPGREATPPTFPHLGLLVAEGRDRAVQLLAPGLPEAEFIQGGSAIALTLLRCVGFLSRDDLRTRGGAAGPQVPTPEAQCEGPHLFHYALRFSGRQNEGRDGHRAWWDALPELDHARYRVRQRPTGGVRQPLAKGNPLPEKWLRNPPAGAITSAFKPACDGQGVVLRAFNPTTEPCLFPLEVPGGWSGFRCDLAEIEYGQAELDHQVVLGPGQITSVKMRPIGPKE